MINEIQRKHFVAVKLLIFALLVFVCAAVAEAKGRKFGLFVGINEYAVPVSPLRGCVNDAEKMQAAMLAKYGFKKADTTILTDAQATREGIIGKIKMYEQMAGEGDLFVFHYSGHGTLFPDANSEEQDETELQYVEIAYGPGASEVIFPRAKYDSAIVPIDVAEATSGKPWQNLILDDELYQMFAAFTKKGAQVVFISDSCHSGSVARAEKNLTKIRFTPLHKAFNAKSFADLNLKKPAADAKPAAAQKQLNGMYLTMTGSKDDEFSLDAGEDGIPMGLFTSTLLKTLNARGAASLTYKKLIESVSPKVSKTALSLNNNQNPQLDSRFGNADKLIFSVPKIKPTGAKRSK